MAFSLYYKKSIKFLDTSIGSPNFIALFIKNEWLIVQTEENAVVIDSSITIKLVLHYVRKFTEYFRFRKAGHVLVNL